ncbi:MAG TPA: carboxymuconolactone decarboxylase family protein [Verrucomicrobiae bacterium]
MKARIEQRKVAPGAIHAMLGLEKYANSCGLPAPLLNLVRLRASQLNGCAYCIDMHAKDLRAGGESEQRIYELNAWRETPFYSEREQAALAWTEAVTNLHDGHVPDGVFEQARKQFSEKELADLTLAIVAINGWNRLNIAFRTVPGGYQAGQLEKMLAEPAA